MIHEFRQPVPCVTELGDAFILYVRSWGYLENDEFTCILKADGSIKHFGSHQVKIHFNATYGIGKATPASSAEQVAPDPAGPLDRFRQEDSPEIALQRQVETRQALRQDSLHR
jgi:hypothetical protein